MEQDLIRLAEISKKPLYVVGGYVRNYLFDGTVSDDIDLASPMTADELLPLLSVVGYNVIAQYKRTNTIIFQKQGGIKYEFTTFRMESYNDGGHTPSEVLYTDDIVLDAKRRDFKCNAVYFDIKKGEVVDKLGGVEDIKNKVLDTVRTPDKVFQDDGLRIMRLCILYGETGFTHKDKLKEISEERILVELKRILLADDKYPFSPKDGHYKGLKMMCETGAMEVVLPEIYLGKGMYQRADYHNYDVLEHILRAVLYADKEVRFAALLHDIGKPYCMQKYGKYHMHDLFGEQIADDVLLRLKVPNREREQLKRLVKYHMLDIRGETKVNKVKLFIVKNYDIFDKMLKLKQADFSACKDDLSVAPTVIKWRNIYADMLKNKVPFSLKALDINGNDLISLGIKGEDVGLILEKLWKHCIYNPKDNFKERLIDLSRKTILNG